MKCPCAPDQWLITPKHTSPGPNSKVNTIILSSHFGIKDVRLNMYTYACIHMQEFCKTKVLLSNLSSSFHILHLIRNFIRHFLIRFMNIHKPSWVNQSKIATKKLDYKCWFNLSKFCFFWSLKHQNHITSSFSSLTFKTIIFKCLSLFLCGIILTANLIPLVSILLHLSFISARVVTRFVKEFHFQLWDHGMNNMKCSRHKANNWNLW